MSITFLLIVINVAISFWAFNNQSIMNQLIFHPASMKDNGQIYRFFSSGFIHADIGHLAFNMISLFFFGDMVEDAFKQIFGNEMGKLFYLLMYGLGLFFALLPTYFEQKNNDYYHSLGASGAVSAVVFAGIFLFPTYKIGIFILPPIIPGFIFGPIYLGLTVYMAKQNTDNINHSAHFWGSAFGVFFVWLFATLFSSFEPISAFIYQVTNYFQ